MNKLSNMFSFVYGDVVITFSRVFKKTRSNIITIKVLPDCSVVASASPHINDQSVLDLVKLRASWIDKKQKMLKERGIVPPRQYVDGEIHYFLGKRYCLKIIENNTAKQSVEIIEKEIVIFVKNRECSNTERLLKSWYKNEANKIFTHRMLALLPKVPWVKEMPNLKLKWMKRQWGNCSKKGDVTLNICLVKSSLDCIDFVILHELCHIKEHNHSKRFYMLMDSVLPNWKIHQKALADTPFYLA